MPAKKPFRPASDAELEVLKILWEEGSGSPADVRESLAERGTDRAYTTIQTLLQRLATKGYVAHRKRGGAHVYEAKLSQEEVLFAHMDDLARRVCDGQTSPLVHSLVRGKALSANDIDHLRDLLDEARARKTKRKRGGSR